MFTKHLATFFVFLSFYTISYATILCDTGGNCDYEACVNGNCSYHLDNTCMVSDNNGKCLDNGNTDVQWETYGSTGIVSVTAPTVKVPVCSWSYKIINGNYVFTPIPDNSDWNCKMDGNNINNIIIRSPR